MRYATVRVTPTTRDVRISYHVTKSPRILQTLTLRLLWACGVLRILKCERYFHVWRAIRQIMAQNSAVLVVVGYAALVQLLGFSFLKFEFEKNNPDSAVSYFLGRNWAIQKRPSESTQNVL